MSVPAHLAHLPIDVDIPMPSEDSIAGWEIFPFHHESLTVKRLGPVELPEPPRNGEDGPDDCFGCTTRDERVVWSDDDWNVRPVSPTSLPVALLLCPNEHADLSDLSSDMLASMGRMLGRLESAVMAVDGVARVHFHKWGDGGAHLHWFAFARPAGLQQLRGSCLVVWDDILPNVPDDAARDNLATVVDALVADGGRSHL